MANLEDARSHAYQNKISSLTEDDFARSQANRTRQSLETHHIAQRRTQDLQDEADQDAIANAPWVNEGIEAESQVISTVQTLSPPIHLASDFKEYQVTPHCTRRVYLAANQPKKLQIPPRCCHDCFGGDGKFPCNRCKARAATSQREVTCRVPCPFGSGILVWTFVRPVQTLKEAVQSNVLFAKIPGSKQGKRRSPVATGSQQIFAEYQTSVLLKPLSLSPPKVIMQNESFDGLLALAEILDVGDVRDTTRSYLPFFDNGCQAWKVANFESPVAPEKPTFWILDPCSSHHDSPVSAKAAVLDIQRLFSKFTYLFCEQSVSNFYDVSFVFTNPPVSFLASRTAVTAVGFSPWRRSSRQNSCRILNHYAFSTLISLGVFALQPLVP